MQLSKNVKIVQVITPTAGAAGTTAIEGTVIDTQGFTGALFIVTLGAIVTGAATSLKVQQGTDGTVSDAADLAGTSQTIADDADGKVLYVDVKKPTERYLRLYVSRATQNATIAAAEVILYGPSDAPTSHGSTVSGESFVSPAEGTA